MSRTIYSHVVVVGLDGAGAFIKDAKTPEFDRIFSNGALTYDALTSFPSISAECWGSMIFGVAPEVHGLTNEIVWKREYPCDSQIPSIFKRIRQARPEAKLGAYCEWKPIAMGMIEKNVNVASVSMKDDELTPVICDYIKKEKPNFLFIHFDSIDAAGHRSGYGNPPHLQRIGEVDALIGMVYNAVCDAGILEDTLFIVVADHGGTQLPSGGGMHGGWTDEEKYVTLALTGKSVVKGYIENANVRDISAIVLHALGIEVPKFDEGGWTSQLPAGIFQDYVQENYQEIQCAEEQKKRVSKVQHTSEEVE